ncbi:MAG: flagellar protein [Lachnospiraceae bacterium]|nr:flagellar protein [Lachnospiraceae bacterium]
MNVRNCKKCGRIFNYISGPITCQKCREELEEKFQEVKKYVRDNPGVDITVVSEECDVEPKQIRRWIQEERLELSEDSPIKIACESCGAMIRSGRFCSKCKAQVTKDFTGIVNQNRVQETSAGEERVSRRSGDKMRFLHGNPGEQ